MKIKVKSEKQIKKSYKFHKICFIIGIFFLALLGAAFLLSNVYVGLIIIIGSLPLIFTILLNQQEMNYNNLLLELRRRK